MSYIPEYTDERLLDQINFYLSTDSKENPEDALLRLIKTCETNGYNQGVMEIRQLLKKAVGYE